MVLPDPIPNSEVKRSDVDGSVVIRHVRVEHRRGFNLFSEFIRKYKLYFSKLTK